VRGRYFVPDIYQVGVGIGIVSISAFFIALIIAYAFRIEEQRTWTRFTVPGLLWVSTGVLCLSSVSFEAARYSLRHGIVSVYRARVLITIALAVVFLIAQVASAREMLAQGVTAAANPHGSAFYVFMGLHAVHLDGGLASLAILWKKSAHLDANSEQGLRRHRRWAGAAMMYWHFMGALWIVLFCFLLRWTSA
jgi:cytochrome c oxidase subunit III